MAISGGDGSIVLTVQIDQAELARALSSMKKTVNKTGTALKQFGSYIVGAFSVAAIIKFSKEAGEMATSQEASIQRLIDIYGEASQSVGNFINENAMALGIAKSSATSFAAVYGNLFSVWADQATNAQLTNQYLNATAVVASKTGRTMEDVQERIRSGLLGNTEAVEDLGIFVNIKTIEMTEAFQSVAKGAKWDSLTAAQQSQVRALAILEQATNKYGSTVANTSALTRAQFNAAWTDFKATWGTVVNGVLMPILSVLTKIINFLTVGMTAIAKFMGKQVTMTTATSNIGSGTSDMADNIGMAAENQENLTENVKGTNKELKKTLAGFDDLQILQSAGGGAGGSAGGGAGGVTAGVPEVSGGGGGAPDVSSWQSAIAGLIEILVGAGLVALGIILCSIGHLTLGVSCIAFGLTAMGVGLVTLGAAFDASGAKEMLLIITGITGFLLLTLGVILLYLGNIPWGIGALVAGIALLGYTAYEAATKMSFDELMSTLSTLLAFVGGALLAIGVFLCWMTVWGWGIACIIAGVAALVGSAVATGKSDSKEIEDWLGVIMTVAGGALLALGIMICVFGGFSPLGIGLIVAGAVVLAVALINKTDTIPEEVKNWINGIFAIVSVAALVLGIIMMCAGQFTPLSIGLVVVGAIGLATEIAVNWEWLKEKLQGWIGVVTGIVSAALLVLGIIILVASGGTALALGLSLIIAGAAGLVTVVAANWDGIVDKVKEIWGKIKQFWNDHIKQIFTKEFWLELAKKCGNGLISGFENAINGIIGMFEKMINWIVDGLNEISFDVPDWVPGIGGKKFGFNIPNVEFGRVSIPRLAQGTVIPPNREFLAVLGDQKHGTNIEAPLQTIVDAFNIALQGNANYGGGNTEVVLEIDGREFGRAVVEQGNRENRRIGTRLVIA